MYKRTNLNMNKIIAEVDEANEVDKGIQSPYFYEYYINYDPFDFAEDLFDDYYAEILYA